MKILYFTTTGNSLFIAKQFKDAELVSIPQLIKHKEYDIEDDVVGIIFPVYVYTSPKLVNYFIDQVNIKAKYIFIIGTYGSSSGLFYQQIEKKLLKKNIKTNYVNKVLMVDNAVHVGFDMKKQKKKKALKLIDEEIKRIKQDIEKRIDYIPSNNILDRLISSLMFLFRPVMYKVSTAKRIKLRDNCTKCGICTTVCPNKNIELKEEITFGSNCELCLACVHACPVKALRLRLEKNDERFRHEKITLEEIINSNKQW